MLGEYLLCIESGQRLLNFLLDIGERLPHRYLSEYRPAQKQVSLQPRTRSRCTRLSSWPWGECGNPGLSRGGTQPRSGPHSSWWGWRYWWTCCSSRWRWRPCIPPRRRATYSEGSRCSGMASWWWRGRRRVPGWKCKYWWPSSSSCTC